MTTRSLYASGQPSQLAEGRQSHSPHNAAFLQVGNRSRETKLPTDPNTLNPFPELRQIYALERRSFL